MYAMRRFALLAASFSLGSVFAELVHTTENKCQLDGTCQQDDDAPSLLQSKIQKKPATGACLNAAEWHEELSKQTPWRKYSQGHQDGILASLFDKAHLGTTNKYFVEFGFHDVEASSTANTALLAEQGWAGLRMDGTVDNPAVAEKKNLHKEFITSDNVASLFRKYDVPHEADYVSIDIDSCDLWVFLALAQEYRPRALTVEYNSKYPVEESKTNVCKSKEGQLYSWNGDDMYGASLAALHKGAEKMNYTMVAVDFKMDVFLVRKDLVCHGTELPLEKFASAAGSPFEKRNGDANTYRKGNASEVATWVMDY